MDVGRSCGVEVIGDWSVFMNSVKEPGAQRLVISLVTC